MMFRPFAFGASIFLLMSIGLGFKRIEHNLLTFKHK